MFAGCNAHYSRPLSGENIIERPHRQHGKRNSRAAAIEPHLERARTPAARFPRDTGTLAEAMAEDKGYMSYLRHNCAYERLTDGNRGHIAAE